MEIRVSKCGNSHEIVYFRMWKYTKNCEFPNMRKYTFFGHISTCRNSSGKVNFRMSVYKRICEFPRGKTCGNTRFFADFRMRKYTRICEFPRAEIHAERCITACGNTLNQVQKHTGCGTTARTYHKEWLWRLHQHYLYRHRMGY